MLWGQEGLFFGNVLLDNVLKRIIIWEVINSKIIDKVVACSFVSTFDLQIVLIKVHIEFKRQLAIIILIILVHQNVTVGIILIMVQIIDRII